MILNRLYSIIITLLLMLLQLLFLLLLMANDVVMLYSLWDYYFYIYELAVNKVLIIINVLNDALLAQFTYLYLLPLSLFLTRRF